MDFMISLKKELSFLEIMNKSSTSNGIEIAKQLFSQIIGEKPTRAELGEGSFVTIHWGKDITETLKTKRRTSTHIFGERRLWICMCAWRIDKNGIPLIGCEDTRTKIEKSLVDLVNKPLLSVKILNNAFDLILKFEDDIEMYLFSFYTEDSDQWVLFNPDNSSFCAGSGGIWHYENPSK